MGKKRYKDEIKCTDGEVTVSYPRELVEREFMCEYMAFRDERMLARLSKEDRERLGDDPTAGIPFLTTLEVAQLGSITGGVFCCTPGAGSFTFGVTCKILKVAS